MGWFDDSPGYDSDESLRYGPVFILQKVRNLLGFDLEYADLYFLNYFFFDFCFAVSINFDLFSYFFNLPSFIILYACQILLDVHQQKFFINIILA